MPEPTCSIGIGTLGELDDPGCGTKLFVIGQDGKGYYVRIEDLWDACPPIRFRQKSWAAPGSGTTANLPNSTEWPPEMEHALLYYNGVLITETTVGGVDWTASAPGVINYPAGFSGGTLTIVVIRYRGV